MAANLDSSSRQLGIVRLAVGLLLIREGGVVVEDALALGAAEATRVPYCVHGREALR